MEHPYDHSLMAFEDLIDLTLYSDADEDESPAPVITRTHPQPRQEGMIRVDEPDESEESEESDLSDGEETNQEAQVADQEAQVADQEVQAVNQEAEVPRYPDTSTQDIGPDGDICLFSKQLVDRPVNRPQALVNNEQCVCLLPFEECCSPLYLCAQQCHWMCFSCAYNMWEEDVNKCRPSDKSTEGNYPRDRISCPYCNVSCKLEKNTAFTFASILDMKDDYEKLERQNKTLAKELVQKNLGLKDAEKEAGTHYHNYKCAEREISRKSDEIKTLKEEIKKLKKPPRKHSNKRPRDEVMDAWTSKDDEAWE